MTLGEAIAQYLETRRKRGLSPRTILADAFWTERFELFCSHIGVRRIAEFESHHLASWLHFLRSGRNKKGKPFSGATIDGAIQVVRRFLRWTVQAGLLLLDPTTELMVRRRLLLHNVLSEEEVDALLNAPDLTTLLGIRDRAILELFYATGIRREECSRLDLADVDLEQRILIVHTGKGQKGRALPICESLAEALAIYLERCRPHLRPRPGQKGFFLDMFGKRLAYAGFGRLVRFHAKAAGLRRPVGPHALRHAFASHILEGGADVREVQELLGHDCIQSTDVYTHLRPIERLRAYRRTHPRARRPRSDDNPDPNFP